MAMKMPCVSACVRARVCVQYVKIQSFRMYQLDIDQAINVNHDKRSIRKYKLEPLNYAVMKHNIRIGAFCKTQIEPVPQYIPYPIIQASFDRVTELYVITYPSYIIQYTHIVISFARPTFRGLIVHQRNSRGFYDDRFDYGFDFSCNGWSFIFFIMSPNLAMKIKLILLLIWVKYSSSVYTVWEKYI